MRQMFCHFMALLLASVSMGCTFYTACPTGGGNNNASGGSGTSGGDGNTPGGAGGDAIPGEWTSVTSNLADLPSECGNLSFLSAKPDEDLLIAGIAQAGLWGSTDGGGTWSELGTGKKSDSIINRTSAIVYDPDDTNRFWESGLYNGGGAYETLDDGVTLKQLGDLAHSDLLSVDFSDPDRKTLLAGGHEMDRTMRRSSDGGMTWESIGSKLPGGTNCTFPLVIDAMTYLVGCAGLGGGPTGIYRTTNGGNKWTSLTTSGGGSPPLRAASDGYIYWASVTNGGMTRSTDHGSTFTDLPNAGLRNASPIELPDGRIAALTDAVVVSDDNGMTWTTVTPKLPYNDAIGLAYSAQEKAFYVWHFTCGAPPVPVPADAIIMFAFDYEAM